MPSSNREHADRWATFRAAMPVTARWVYFDHAAVAPLTRPAAEAIAAWLRQAAEQGDTVWPQWAARIEQIRARVASLIGADADEIALVHNTTSGIGLVAEGFPWRDGDNVVTPANEFPSNLYPWMNLAGRGVETRRVEFADVALDLDRLFDACDHRTRVIALSWIGYATGWRVDVAEVVRRAHERGIKVFLDAIQGIGVFPIDVRDTGVDFLAADGHKWMLGPEGAGIFYCRREHLDLLRPLNVGWNSVKHFQDFSRIALDLRPQAARYEGGSQNMVGFLGLGASLDLLADLGLSATDSPLAERVREVADYASLRLEQSGAVIVSRRQPPHDSGIVSFDTPARDPVQLRHKLLAAGVALSCRGGRLRISPHAYNNEDDVERLIDVLQQP